MLQDEVTPVIALPMMSSAKSWGGGNPNRPSLHLNGATGSSPLSILMKETGEK